MNEKVNLSTVIEVLMVVLPELGKDSRLKLQPVSCSQLKLTGSRIGEYVSFSFRHHQK
jgi:hypothetical protein